MGPPDSHEASIGGPGVAWVHRAQSPPLTPASLPHSVAPLPTGSPYAFLIRVCIVSGRQTGIFRGPAQHPRTIEVERVDRVQLPVLPHPHWSLSPASPAHLRAKLYTW